MSTNFDVEIFGGRSSQFAEDSLRQIHTENEKVPQADFRTSYGFQPNVGEVLDGDNFRHAFHTSDHTDIDDTVVLEELDREYRRYVYKVERPNSKNSFGRDMPFAYHNGYFTGFEEAQYHQGNPYHQGHPYHQGWFGDVGHESTEHFKDVMCQDLDDPWTSFEKELSDAHDKHNEAMYGKEEDSMNIYDDNTTNASAYPFPCCGPNVYEIKNSATHFSNDLSPSSSEWATNDRFIENKGFPTFSSCNETFSNDTFQGISIGDNGLYSSNYQGQQFCKQSDCFAYNHSHYEQAQSNFNGWDLPNIDTKQDPLSKNHSGKYNNDSNIYDNHACVFDNTSTSMDDLLSCTCEDTFQSNNEDPVVAEPTGISWTHPTSQLKSWKQENEDELQRFDKTMKASDEEGVDESPNINNEATASAQGTCSWQSTNEPIDMESSTSSRISVSSSTIDFINADSVESTSVKLNAIVIEEKDQDHLDNDCQKCLPCGIQTPIMAVKSIASKVGSIFHRPSKTTTRKSYTSNAMNEGESQPSQEDKPSRAHRLKNKVIQTMKSVFFRRS